MKAAYDTLIRPQYEELSKALGLKPKQDDDYTVIPVRVTFKSGTTQVIEDGMFTECDHAGATLGDVDLSFLYFNPNTGSVEDFDNNHVGLVCDQCPAWQSVDGEWHEQ